MSAATNQGGIDLLSELVVDSVIASKEAAAIIRRIKRSGDLGIEDKSKGGGEKPDYVTEADKQSQKYITGYLNKKYPGIKYQGEETLEACIYFMI